ncbi:hypothetical protein RRG08_043814 [Elysia crispata]|uniref:Uncharacterized protein n=1 Tax=Elysia crispata TaxID=231223 RepID=A0AAE1B6J8_9GAST|nr:hypothetical protein RRG08_043814 [Elysia crispata]
MHHVPEDIQVMPDDYFRGFRMRFSTDSYTTDWINLGCSISPILFAMAMEVVRKKAYRSAGPQNLGDGCYMSPFKALMDDTTIIFPNEEWNTPNARALRRLNSMVLDEIQIQEILQSLDEER